MMDVPSTSGIDERVRTPTPSPRPHTPSRVFEPPVLHSPDSVESPPPVAKAGMSPARRYTLGICLLLVTVFLWTTSNFLASTIFADNSYSKPYFVTYINTSFFAVPFAFIILHKTYTDPGSLTAFWKSVQRSRFLSSVYTRDRSEANALLKPDDDETPIRQMSPSRPLDVEDELGNSQTRLLNPNENSSGRLDLWQTAKLSLEFCILWFLANYFVAACLEYTTVASGTILTSTSSVFTLVFGALVRVERFTVRKLASVLASLLGVALISTVDLSGESDETRGDFPHKSRHEIAVGDLMALLSAVLYGIYAVVMKKRIGDESRVNMLIFFGYVGLFNVVFLWPGLLILHFTGVERFELPPNGRILSIVLINSASSLLSDLTWAYAMLLTSPLVITVGLSMTIPLSLIGQIILNSQTASFIYWLGAVVVLLSFLFVNHESRDEEEAAAVNVSRPPPTEA